MDGGLAAERTELAWRRNGLSVILAGLAIAKGLPDPTGIPGRPFLGLGVAIVGAALFAVSRFQAVRRANHPSLMRPTAQGHDLLPVMVATVAIAVAATLVVLLA